MASPLVVVVHLTLAAHTVFCCVHGAHLPSAMHFFTCLQATFLTASAAAAVTIHLSLLVYYLPLLLPRPRSLTLFTVSLCSSSFSYSSSHTHAQIRNRSRAAAAVAGTDWLTDWDVFIRTSNTHTKRKASRRTGQTQTSAVQVALLIVFFFFCCFAPSSQFHPKFTLLSYFKKL